MPRIRPKCSECGRPSHAQGLCSTHYTRLRKSGKFQPAHTPTMAERFWRRVDASGDCWTWTAHRDLFGYGIFREGTQRLRAHRVAYELLIGPIPEGLVIDHLCRNTSCVNPSHLEPVTTRVNTLRGVGRAAKQAQQTHCKRGHEFTPENTYLELGGRKRVCRTCKLASQRGWVEVDHGSE